MVSPLCPRPAHRSQSKRSCAPLPGKACRGSSLLCTLTHAQALLLLDPRRLLHRRRQPLLHTSSPTAGGTLSYSCLPQLLIAAQLSALPAAVLLHFSSHRVIANNPPLRPPVRPSLSPHQSHAGYLTLSSPLIASLAVKAPSVTQLSSAETNPPHDDTLAPKHANTLQPDSKERRGSSPGRKLKGAFGPRKTPSPKGTTESLKTTERGGGGGGLGSLFAGGKKSRSSSKVSLVEEALQDSAQVQQAEGQQAPPS